MSVRGGGTGISYPVSISDVQTVLGNSSSELKALCTATNINRWARFKPERYDGHLPISHDTRKANHFSLEVPYCIEWISKSWGVSSWYQDCMAGMVYDIINGDYEPWNYLQPRGDMSQTASHTREFYRLSDFAALTSDVIHDMHPADYDSLKGYNHYCDIPFSAVLNTPATVMLDGSYQFNKSSGLVTFTFYNGRGNDLLLQDLIDFTQNEGTADNQKAWRPVLQVFNNDRVLNSLNDNDREYWYNRTQPDIEVVGNPITTNIGDTWTVSLDISNFDNDPNKYYHLCIGVGCCTKTDNPRSWYGGNDLFILPFVDTPETTVDEIPFYYKFAVASHFDRQLHFINMVYGTSSPVAFVGSHVTIPWAATGTLIFEITINKEDGDTNPNAVPLHFIKEHGTADSGYTSLKICLEDRTSHNLYYLTPCQGISSRTEAQHAHVDVWHSGDSTTQTLYGMTTEINVDGNYLRPGESWSFQVKGLIGSSDVDDAGAIMITKQSQS